MPSPDPPARRSASAQDYVAPADELPLSGPALLALLQAVLERGKPFRFSARGWSMAPFIQDGDVITVAPLQPSRAGGKPRLVTGAIVAFVHPLSGSLVVHRVVARRGAEVWIQGDSLPAVSDGPVPLHNLLGQVTRIERRGRAVRLGLGPERRLIAALSRRGWPAMGLFRTARRLRQALSPRRKRP